LIVIEGSSTVANILAILAFLIAALVVAKKYFNVTIPTVTEMAMRDPVVTLLIAVVLALLARAV
jgi:hypothetical protein